MLTSSKPKEDIALGNRCHWLKP